MTIIQSTALLYLSVFISSSLFVNKSSKIKGKFLPRKTLKLVLLLIGLSILSYMAGIRFGIGTDYFSYVDIFKVASLQSDTRIEPGYILLNVIVKFLGGNEHVLFFIVEFLTILFVYLFLNTYNEKIDLGLGMITFLLFYYNYSFNAVRQSLAMSIGLYSFVYIDKKNIKKFLFFIILAMSMHIGALIILPFYFLYNSLGKKSKMFRFFIYLVAFVGIINYQQIIFFFSNYILDSSYYLQYAKGGEVNLGIGWFVIYSPYILPGLVFFKKLSKDTSFRFYYFLLIIGFILKLTIYFGGAFLDRVADFFLIVVVWLVPYYYKVFKKSRYLFWIPMWAVINSLVYWYVIYINNGASETIPYITIFQ